MPVAPATAQAAPVPHPLARALAARFPALAGQVTSPRGRRVFAEPAPEGFREVFDFAVAELGFDRLVAITGMDEKTSLVALYALSRPDGTILGLRRRVPREAPVLASVTDRFPGAANYERELDDLLGFEVTDLPPGKRYPLPDDWPKDEKPLRKDWKPGSPA
ncbi:MAG TPA: NADH-quinone oxidoreductase subunit C [Anaeromyxobacteraceae bacterium]